MDTEVQAGEPRVSEYLQPEHTNTIVGDGSEIEKVRKEAETLREKLREFDGMDWKVVKRFRGKTLEEIDKTLDDEVEEKIKKLSNEIRQLKELNKLLEQEIKSKQKLLEEENNEHNYWWNQFDKASDEVERLKKQLFKIGRLNPGAEVAQCEDPKEYGRAEILYEMTRLLKDLFVHVANKSLTRKALDEAKKNFETLKKMYAPCTCKNDACAKLREEREAYIAEVARALENAERFLPSDLSEARTSEMFLSSKPKTFSPSKPKKQKVFRSKPISIGNFSKKRKRNIRRFWNRFRLRERKGGFKEGD